MQLFPMLVCISIFLFGLLQDNQVSSLILSPTQQCILNDFSWKIKVKLLNSLFPNKATRRSGVIQSLVYSNTTVNHLKNDKSKPRNVDIQSLTLRKKNVQLAKALRRNVAIEYLVKGPISRKKNQRIDDTESSMSFDEKPDSKSLDFEAMGVHDGLLTDHNNDLNKKLLYRRRDPPGNPDAHQADEVESEKDMKLKVFRLMYDTVKENDELVRKADTIKKKYDNSSFFEIGFIMGAITDKVNIMSEVALTVERLFEDWKPIEHVNAYEQIANQAVEITHLVDVLKSTDKKSEAIAKKEEKAPERSAYRRPNEFMGLHDLKQVTGKQLLRAGFGNFDGRQLPPRDIERTF